MTAGVIRETVEVANALGVDAQASRVEHAVNHAFANHHQHKPSMLQDVEAKRKTEIDFINGAVVERANEQGIDTPVLSSLHSLVKLIEGAYL